MTKLSDYNARAVGVPWVREEDYAAFLAICEDSDQLPATWEIFVKFSEEAENAYRIKGYIVERAYIDPDTFPGWCRTNGCGINSKARKAFAAAFVGAKYGKNSG